MKKIFYYLNYKCTKCGTKYGKLPSYCNCCGSKSFIKIESEKQTL